MIRHNLFALLQQAERINNKKYSWAHIARQIKRSRQATEKLFLDEQTDDSYMKYGTMDRLLRFFRAEGLAVGVADLFVVGE